MPTTIIPLGRDSTTGQVKQWAPGDTLLGGSIAYDNGNSGAAINIDWNNGYVQIVTLTNNCTLSFSNQTSGARLILEVIQDGVGGWLATWPGTVKWEGGSSPTLTVTPTKTDIVGFFSDGINEFGQVYGLNY